MASVGTMQRPQVSHEVKEFIQKFTKELSESNAAVFVGAGLSKAAGYVDWPSLMAPIAEGLGLDIAKETDLVSLAQYHLNANATHRQQLNQLLVENFSDLREPSENHRLLARLPIRTFWTTNYDRLLESALQSSGKRVDAKYTNAQLATTRRGRDVTIYKMHGDVEHPDKAILTKDDYERYTSTHSPFIEALSGDLVEKTFLFIGFSFTDPNIDFILSRIRSRYSSSQRQHYYMAKRRSRIKNETQKNYQYGLTKQALVVQDLMRFNIRTVLLDDYKEVPDILREIERHNRRSTIFVSGSAEDFAPWGRPATEQFLSALAAELIRRDFKIASGFGLGIGTAVVTGAVQEIYSTSDRGIDDQIILRPFPRGIRNAMEREKTYARYRNDLIAQAGVAIFVMGNKIVDGSTSKADGVLQEFSIARQLGLYLVPIGCSGWIASDLFRVVMEEAQQLFPRNSRKIVPLLEELGKPQPDPLKIIPPLVQLIETLRKE